MQASRHLWPGPEGVSEPGRLRPHLRAELGQCPAEVGGGLNLELVLADVVRSVKGHEEGARGFVQYSHAVSRSRQAHLMSARPEMAPHAFRRHSAHAGQRSVKINCRPGSFSHPQTVVFEPLALLIMAHQAAKAQSAKHVLCGSEVQRLDQQVRVHIRPPLVRSIEPGRDSWTLQQHVFYGGPAQS
jgi:hypothetical protein